jgi:hypothetical protein
MRGPIACWIACIRSMVFRSCSSSSCSCPSSFLCVIRVKRTSFVTSTLAAFPDPHPRTKDDDEYEYEHDDEDEHDALGASQKRADPSQGPDSIAEYFEGREEWNGE